jgi:hypothetical protein
MLGKMTKMHHQTGLDGIKIHLSKSFQQDTASYQFSLFFQDSCCQSVGSKVERLIQFMELPLDDTLDL